MSPDLRELLHAAAPVPARGFDARAIERRARRFVVVRAALVCLGLLVAAGGSLLTTSLLSEKTGFVGPQPAPPQPEVDVDRRENSIPRGPRHEIASGVYGDDWDGAWAGKRWRLLVWGDAETICWQLAEGDAGPRSNVGCSHDLEPSDLEAMVFGMTSTSVTGSDDPAEYAFVSGVLGPRVDRLVFRGDRGPDLSVPLYSAPPGTGIATRFYATVLPSHDYGRLEALAADGEVLASRRLCGVGCQADRERAQAVEVLSFEHTPVTVESAAAAFAVEAAGRAGVMNQLGTYWSYRTTSADDLLATFRATQCSGGLPDGTYRCDPNMAPASIDVGVDGDRFVVESVQGPMDDEQRAALEGFSAPVTDDVREWRPIAESFARSGRSEWDVAFLMVWTGNLGAPRDYGSTCRYTIHDGGGRLVHRSPKLPFFVRAGEHNRVTGFTTTIDTDRRPSGLSIECSEPGPGLTYDP